MVATLQNTTKGGTQKKGRCGGSLNNNTKFYIGICIKGSPKAEESWAIDRKVRFGKPVVQRETTASLFPSLFAKSRCVMCFSLRIKSILSMMPADSCTSVMISGDTEATFSLNHACLFFISFSSCCKDNKSLAYKLNFWNFFLQQPTKKATLKNEDQCNDSSNGLVLRG